MQTPLEVLASYGIPTTSYIRAAVFASGMNLGQQRYQRVIADIVGSDTPPTYTNEKEARMYFRYTVQETVQAFLTGQIPDMAVVWDTARQRAQEFIRQHPWCIKEYITEVNGQDAVGNPKQKKGAKKEQAQVLYLRMNNGTNDRHTIIQALMDEVSMTKQGATTYFHNLKKEFGYKGPKTERKKRVKAVGVKENLKRMEKEKKTARKKRTGPSKSSIAEQVYLRMRGLPKPEIIKAIVAEAKTSPAGANTYYCKWRKEHGDV